MNRKCTLTKADSFGPASGRITVSGIIRNSSGEAARIRTIKRIAILIAVILAAIIFSIVIFANIVNAQSENRSDNSVKGYMYFNVQSNDTLWSIASEYADGHYTSLYQYIREVKELNGLTSDSIHAGSKLIIPVYTTLQACQEESEDICQGTR